ncbi:MAG: nitroreductase family protein [Lachnospiraceae bacterium]|nr:nitroreductase family protein [Lachnospiraceae bacterium]
MKLIELLKQNDALRRVVKKEKIRQEFLNDAKIFSEHYLEKAEDKGNYKFRIMLIVHSIEKGLCMPQPRYFGREKVLQLVNILNHYSSVSDFEYQLGYSVLQEWCKFIDEYEWERDDTYILVEKFLKDNAILSNYRAGKQLMYAPLLSVEDSFEKVIFSRHSVRDFQDKPLEQYDIEFALKCFLEAPTACNRQMCKIYKIDNCEIKKILDNTIMGVSGFNKNTVTYFIVTYDTAAFEYYGERNQGYLNAGLTSMNFINGLHARNIGSCFMQWSNKKSEDTMIKRKLKLPVSEKIAIVIGAGYYKERCLIPCSCRRPMEDVFFVVK